MLTGSINGFIAEEVQPATHKNSWHLERRCQLLMGSTNCKKQTKNYISQTAIPALYNQEKAGILKGWVSMAWQRFKSHMVHMLVYLAQNRTVKMQFGYGLLRHLCLRSYRQWTLHQTAGMWRFLLSNKCAVLIYITDFITYKHFQKAKCLTALVAVHSW